MSAVLFWWSLLGLVIHVSFAMIVVWGTTRLARLRYLPDTAPDNTWPSLSIVIPARNEERDIQAALTSVLQLDYPDYEVIAVNDRSTDRTGDILEEFAQGQPRLKVVHVQDLPPAWLGKNHALQCGADQARGELLLFTDADVVFEPSALRRAVRYLVTEHVDHLAATPRVRMPGFWLESFVLTFMLFFVAYFRPWKARDPRSRAYIGIGAFNLVRSAAYREIGGHAPIAMRPDDDVQLGHLIKLRGKTQDIVDGVGMLDVPWYASIGEVIRGLEKNAFSGVDYRIWVTVVSSLIALAFNVAPFALVWVASGPARWMFLASDLVLLGVCAASARATQLNPWAALGFPVSVLLFVYIQWRTMILTLAQGGIRWRDTFYPLAVLKANRVR